MRRTARGFTLLEMIVATGIMVLVAATAAATINASFSLKRAAEDAIASTRDTEIVGDVFVEQLGNAVPPNPNAAPDPNLADGSVSTTVLPLFRAGPFYGDAANIYFYASTVVPKSGLELDGSMASDIHYIEFGLSSDKSGATSFVRRQKTNLLEDMVTDPTEEVLVTNVEAVEFSYFDGTSWQPVWDSSTLGNVLPYAVQMTLTLKPLSPGKPDRVITRYASLPCAIPSTQPAAGTITTAIGGTP